MNKYSIIITRDRKKFRHLKSYSVKQNATSFFKNISEKNREVKFEKKFFNYLPVKYHIELLSPKKFFDVIEWERDKLGRNIPAPERNGAWIWKKLDWKEPETFQIYGVPGKQDYDGLIGLIKKTKDIIAMSTIQNILVLDIDGKPILVILKNVEDAQRLYKVIRSENLKNVLCFGKMSKINRKVFYKKISLLGIPVKMFYTKSTRW